MNFFKDLPPQLLKSSTAAFKQQVQGAEEAAVTGDVEAFHNLLTRQHYANFAYMEQGRVNHEMFRTTLDSFQ